MVFPLTKLVIVCCSEEELVIGLEVMELELEELELELEELEELVVEEGNNDEELDDDELEEELNDELEDTLELKLDEELELKEELEEEDDETLDEKLNEEVELKELKELKEDEGCEIDVNEVEATLVLELKLEVDKLVVFCAPTKPQHQSHAITTNITLIPPSTVAVIVAFGRFQIPILTASDKPESLFDLARSVSLFLARSRKAQHVFFWN